MDVGHTNLFDLARTTAGTGRNAVRPLLAQNIANADTPGYRAQGRRAVRPDPGARRPAASWPAPSPTTWPARPRIAVRSCSRSPRSARPDGNAVALDEQLTKVADTQTTQALVTAIYRKYLTMFSMALGRTG